MALPTHKPFAGTAWPTLVGCLLVVGLSVAVYARNLDDYFLSDDFDLIVSFYGQPPSYFVQLLWSNENGTVWDTMCINNPAACDDPEHHGYLRPLKIWLLAAELALWGTRAWPFHVVSTLFFAATVVLVFLILQTLLRGDPWLSLFGAVVVALHPVFGEIVPFITAREETMTAAFTLAAILFFLRHRLRGTSPVGFSVCFVLALLTKESGITTLAYPLVYDAIQLPFAPDRRAEIRARSRVYLAVPPILAAYFILRFVAFHNLVGGHGSGETRYFALDAFLDFHRGFFSEFLFGPAMIHAGGLPLGALAGTALVGAAAVLAWRARCVKAGTLGRVLIVGPGWYLAATSIAYGIYPSARHNAVAVIALALFAAVLLDALLEAGDLVRGWREATAVLGVALAVVLFWAPTRAISVQFEAASAEVARVRAWIEDRTADLPPGSTIYLDNVPQLEHPPWFFGWGLQSALKRPFTASDLANRSAVYNRRNIALMVYDVEIPEPVDLRLDARLAFADER